MVEQEDYYALLGVRPSAPQPEITQAYTTKVAQNASDPGMLIRLGTAFQVLLDPTRREEYDRERAPFAPPAPPMTGPIGPGAPAARPSIMTAPPTVSPLSAPPSPPPVYDLSDDDPMPISVMIPFQAAAPTGSGPDQTITVSAPSAFADENAATMPSVPAQPAPGPSDPNRTVLTGPGGPPPPGEVTQQPTTLICPVCAATNFVGPVLSDAYCQDCGFLLSQTPGEGQAAGAGGITLSSADREFLLREGVNVVGRQDAEVLLIDSTVSRLHARLSVSGDQLTVEDANSTNGTKLNGTRLDPGRVTPVKDGDEIQFGQIALKVKGAAASAAQTSAPVGDSGITEAAEAAGPEIGRLVGVGNNHTFPLVRLPVTVGRRAGAGIVIQDPYVSGQHAELSMVDGTLTVRDLGSTNGTLVAGEPLPGGTSAPLRPGSTVQFGKMKFQLLAAGAETAAEAPAESVQAAKAPEATTDGAAETTAIPPIEPVTTEDTSEPPNDLTT